MKESTSPLVLGRETTNRFNDHPWETILFRSSRGQNREKHNNARPFVEISAQLRATRAEVSWKVTRGENFVRNRRKVLRVSKTRNEREEPSPRAMTGHATRHTFPLATKSLAKRRQVFNFAIRDPPVIHGTFAIYESFGTEHCVQHSNPSGRRTLRKEEACVELPFLRKTLSNTRVHTHLNTHADRWRVRSHEHTTDTTPNIHERPFPEQTYERNNATGG